MSVLPVWSMQRWPRAALLPALLVLTGCLGGGAAPIRYYLVDPVEQAPVQTPTDGNHQPLAVEVLDLRIPKYLDRFNIVRRTADGRLHLSDAHQWSENLRENLTRVLARNLASALNTVDVATPFGRTGSTPDYRVQLFIEEFAQDVDGSVRLHARWQLSDGRTSRVLGMQAEQLQRSGVPAGDYEAIVAAMRNLYGELCAAIARSIVAQARPA